MATYPTKEAIMAEPSPQFSPDDIDIVKNWKQAHFKGWSQLDIDAKLEALKVLVRSLVFGVIPVSGDHYCYVNKSTPIIMFDAANPSILSTLHEIGHARHGSSELEACRFSVWLFKICFPRSFEQLSWDGHMLKKQ